MGNHYHLLLETPEANLSRGMRLLQGIYTIRHNARHRLRGHLFQGRYKAIVVDGEDALYFRTLGDYIHLNPVRAGLLAEGETLESYRWSSFPLHAGSPEKRPSWLKSEWILGGGGEADTTQGRSSYRNAMEKRAVDEREGEVIEDGLLKALRRGWCFGSEKFRETIMEKLQSSQEHRVSNGVIGRSHNEKEAEKLIVAALKKMGIMPGDLEKLPKGSAQKIAIATVVKQRTAVTNAWLAERLNMGAATRVSRYCGSFSERDDIKELIQKIKMSIGEN